MPKSAKYSVKVEGLSDLVDALGELSKATSTNVQKRALQQAAEPIQSAAESMAPRRTGLLASTITIGTRLSPRQRAGHKKESRVEIYVGPASMTRAIVQEFGSIYQSPKPYMRPAWDQNKEESLKSLSDVLKEEIDKAVQRAARKAARLLAKMKVTT